MIGGVEELVRQDELEVVFSLMTDKELLVMRDKVEQLLKEGVYDTPKFPLSAGGLRVVIADIMFSYWLRRGKGVRIEEGKVVVCELSESPFMKRYLDNLDDDREWYIKDKEKDKDILRCSREEVGEWV